MRHIQERPFATAHDHDRSCLHSKDGGLTARCHRLGMPFPDVDSNAILAADNNHPRTVANLPDPQSSIQQHAGPAADAGTCSSSSKHDENSSLSNKRTGQQMGKIPRTSDNCSMFCQPVPQSCPESPVAHCPSQQTLLSAGVTMDHTSHIDHPPPSRIVAFFGTGTTTTAKKLAA